MFKKVQRVFCQTPLIILYFLLSLKLFSYSLWHRGLRARRYFRGQTSQLHAAQKTERDSPWNRILKTGFLQNCCVLSRLWQTAAEDDRCCLELLCCGRIEETTACSVLCWLWTDFLPGLLCARLPSLPMHPFGEQLAGAEQPGSRWRITVCWSSFSFLSKTPRETRGKVMWDPKQ